MTITIKGIPVDELVQEAYQTAVEKGWHEEKREFGTLIALMHSEVTEALDETEDEKVAEELADVVIRVLDMSGLYEFDLEKSMEKLQEENFKFQNDITSFWNLENNFTMFIIMATDLNKYLSYVLEIYRKKDSTKEEIEMGMAKVVRLTMHIAKSFNLDVEEMIIKKIEKNKKRPFKHGGKKI